MDNNNYKVENKKEVEGYLNWAVLIFLVTFTQGKKLAEA